VKYIDNLKIELLENDLGKEEYIEKFIDATYEFFLQNKITPTKYKPFYEYIKKHFVFDRVELHKLLRLQFGTEASTFVDVWIEQKEKKDRQAANKEERVEQKSQEFSKANVVQLLALKERSRATEMIVKEIKSMYKIYTLRHDEKEEIWIYKDGIYVPEGKTYIKEFVRETLGDLYTTHLSNLIIEKIETDTFIQDEDFFIDEDPNLICLQNGIFNLKTKRLMDYDDKYFFFQKLPIFYDKKARCRNIIKFFESTLKEGDVKTLQEIFGFMLYREYRYEKAFMFSGDGSNGKSKSVELFKRFLGINNCASLSLQRMEAHQNFDLCELHTKLANLSADLSYSSLKDTGNFKSLTGRDPISAPRKFKTNLKFTNYAKMVFCANELPKPVDISTGFFRRWILIDFPYTFYTADEYDNHKDEKGAKKADPKIIEKISTQEELNGLFNWAVKGWERLEKNKSFSNTRSMQELKETWIAKSDSFQAFCTKYVIEDFDHSIRKSSVLRYYTKYCKMNKLRTFGEKHIKAVLEREFGVYDSRKIVDDEKVSFWEGIAFNDFVCELLDKGQVRQEGQHILKDIGI